MSELDRDLGAWTREELSREQLLAVHGAAAAALVAGHDRLTGAAAAVTVPSVEAGWAALLARIDAPAPVVPLRRPRLRRTLSIAVAAALALAGIAYAASRGSHDGSPVVSPATTAPAVAGAFSRWHGRSAPGPTVRTAPPSGSHRHSGSGPSAHGGGATPGIDGGAGGGSAKPGDDPHDRDQGTGNDGSHNDQGSGNNGSEGSPPPESHGR
jgi:hypothetical protein